MSALIRAWLRRTKASTRCGIKLIVGSEFLLGDGEAVFKLILLAPSRAAYSEISALITKGRRRSAKGEYSLNISDLVFGLQHCLAIWLPGDSKHELLLGGKLKHLFKGRLWMGVELFWHSADQQHYLFCADLSFALGINMVACNDVHMHRKNRKPLQDTLTAIRLNTTIQKLGLSRQSNAERYLKPVKVLQHQYPPALLEESLRIADLCHFSMDELRYEYPREVVPANLTAHQYLKKLSHRGAQLRWPNGVPDKIVNLLAYELAVIQELQYEYYFLTVYDIVAFARSAEYSLSGSRFGGQFSCLLLPVYYRG